MKSTHCLKLRDLCQAQGIYGLSFLAALEAAEPDVCIAGIRERLSASGRAISGQGCSDLMKKLEGWGLIRKITRRKGLATRFVERTQAGEQLLADIRAAFRD